MLSLEDPRPHPPPPHTHTHTHTHTHSHAHIHTCTTNKGGRRPCGLLRAPHPGLSGGAAAGRGRGRTRPHRAAHQARQAGPLLGCPAGAGRALCCAVLCCAVLAGQPGSRRAPAGHAPPLAKRPRPRRAPLPHRRGTAFLWHQARRPTSLACVPGLPGPAALQLPAAACRPRLPSPPAASRRTHTRARPCPPTPPGALHGCGAHHGGPRPGGAFHRAPAA